jgi:hypothetical protein
MNSLRSSASRRILVIDDNRAIHEDFAKILVPSAPSDDSPSWRPRSSIVPFQCERRSAST